jgi:hypothetical protein
MSKNDVDELGQLLQKLGQTLAQSLSI